MSKALLKITMFFILFFWCGPAWTDDYYAVIYYPHNNSQVCLATQSEESYNFKLSNMKAKGGILVENDWVGWQKHQKKHACSHEALLSNLPASNQTGEQMTGFQDNFSNSSDNQEIFYWFLIILAMIIVCFVVLPSKIKSDQKK